MYFRKAVLLVQFSGICAILSSPLQWLGYDNEMPSLMQLPNDSPVYRECTLHQSEESRCACHAYMDVHLDCLKKRNVDDYIIQDFETAALAVCRREEEEQKAFPHPNNELHESSTVVTPKDSKFTTTAQIYDPPPSAAFPPALPPSAEPSQPLISATQSRLAPQYPDQTFPQPPSPTVRVTPSSAFIDAPSPSLHAPSAIPPGVVPPGQVPGQVPGEVPGQIPGKIPGEIPGEIPGHVPGETPGRVSGDAPGEIGFQPPIHEQINRPYRHSEQTSTGAVQRPQTRTAWSASAPRHTSIYLPLPPAMGNPTHTTIERPTPPLPSAQSPEQISSPPVFITLPPGPVVTATVTYTDLVTVRPDSPVPMPIPLPRGALPKPEVEDHEEEDDENEEEQEEDDENEKQYKTLNPTECNLDGEDGCQGEINLPQDPMPWPEKSASHSDSRTRPETSREIDEEECEEGSAEADDEHMELETEFKDPGSDEDNGSLEIDEASEKNQNIWEDRQSNIFRLREDGREAERRREEDRNLEKTQINQEDHSKSPDNDASEIKENNEAKTMEEATDTDASDFIGANDAVVDKETVADENKNDNENTFRDNNIYRGGEHGSQVATDTSAEDRDGSTIIEKNEQSIEMTENENELDLDTGGESNHSAAEGITRQAMHHEELKIDEEGETPQDVAAWELAGREPQPFGEAPTNGREISESNRSEESTEDIAKPGMGENDNKKIQKDTQSSDELSTEQYRGSDGNNYYEFDNRRYDYGTEREYYGHYDSSYDEGENTDPYEDLYENSRRLQAGYQRPSLKSGQQDYSYREYDERTGRYYEWPNNGEPHMAWEEDQPLESGGSHGIPTADSNYRYGYDPVNNKNNYNGDDDNEDSRRRRLRNVFRRPLEANSKNQEKDRNNKSRFFNPWINQQQKQQPTRQMATSITTSLTGATPSSLTMQPVPPIQTLSTVAPSRFFNRPLVGGWQPSDTAVPSSQPSPSAVVIKHTEYVTKTNVIVRTQSPQVITVTQFDSQPEVPGAQPAPAPQFDPPASGSETSAPEASPSNYPPSPLKVLSSLFDEPAVSTLTASASSTSSLLTVEQALTKITSISQVKTRSLSSVKKEGLPNETTRSSVEEPIKAASENGLVDLEGEQQNQDEWPQEHRLQEPDYDYTEPIFTNMKMARSTMAVNRANTCIVRDKMIVSVILIAAEIFL